MGLRPPTLKDVEDRLHRRRMLRRAWAFMAAFWSFLFICCAVLIRLEWDVDRTMAYVDCVFGCVQLTMLYLCVVRLQE
jgi:hypothetical protein